MKSKTGFTKSECLVCLGCAVFVLANIAAIGNSGRKRAKEAVCLSNLRQWGVVFSQFAADNEGGTPIPWCTDTRTVWNNNNCYPPPKPPQWWWYNVLGPYYNNANELLLCPATTQPSSGGHGAVMADFEYWTVGSLLEGGKIGSYGVNQWALNPPTSPPPCSGLPPSHYDFISVSGGVDIFPNSDFWHRMDVSGADNIPLLAGGSFPFAAPFSEVTATYYSPQAFDPLQCSTAQLRNSGAAIGYSGVELMTFFWGRHNGATNMVFMDLSARKFSPKQIWSLKWNRIWNTCNPYTACGGVGPSDWPTWMQDFTEPVP